MNRPPAPARSSSLAFWTVVIASLLCAAPIGLLGVLAPFGERSELVDPRSLPASTPYTVTVSELGERAHVTCPSIVSYLGGDRRPGCPPPTSSAAFTAVALALAGALVAMAWYVWRRRAAMSAAPPATLRYQQDAMPRGWWAGVIGIGSFAALMGTSMFRAAVTGGTGWAGGLGALGLYGTVTFACVTVYGKKAYRLDLLSTSVRWRAPMRRGEVAIADIASVTVASAGGTLGERNGTITTRTGEQIAISLPNRKHADRFLAFCQTIRAGNPDIRIEDERRAAKSAA